MTMLNEYDVLPEGLLDKEATGLHEVLPGPSIIHLKGRHEPPLFVSVLLHGNEDTGWCAIRQLLCDYATKELPRCLSLFIGNIEAARYGQRYLGHQPDYNRIWRVHKGDTVTPEHKMMQQVTDIMKQRGVFASLDVHNNTGTNPHYACVNKLDDPFLHLARLFSRSVVYFTKPDNVQSRAFSALCPAVTAECGQPGQPHGMQHAVEFLGAALRLSEHPAHPVTHGDIDLFHTVAIAKVPDAISFEFKAGDSDIQFIDNLDYLNFRELPEQTLLGWVRSREVIRLDVRDEQGRDVYQRFFNISNGELRTAAPMMPSMLTVNARAIRQDCLCYIMERMSLSS
ncbi:MAG: hypothetical protein BMS9Abin36_1701 [Gammaproteobacteria bacterium]|nr:MAG: hypothetical protein BMS9Abin36_1701 [Gammaproteobacteria bacterium]